MNSLGVLAETIFALDSLDDSGSGVFRRWRQRVRHELERQGSPTRILPPPLRPLSSLLWLIDRGPQRGLDELAEMGCNPQRISAAVQDFSRVAIKPYWERMSAYREIEREARGRMVLTGGTESILANLGARTTWQAPVLEISRADSRDVHLDGRGLLLAPAVFLSDRAVFIESHRVLGRPAVLFPALPDQAMASALWKEPVNSTAGLAALMGHTRAAVLRELANSASTGELAERLGISPAGASQHATVLRKAGLITTQRQRNTVLHVPTRLGMALLTGQNGQSFGLE
ncbi:ArsR/SmtB family transcription factor [Micromonospora siamensis]|uniref:Helix-turn-helix domain-containing protein n=1 Tax=Micromonospora siamensis TaxID=299152 RepID=A0A1C5HE97_9ACTN|nr:winged helix-turn-helix domain-containing protein [Micromonospora siamensis]SCG44379.1 Helix-turn-helix domain-containing protein [Micromonospora siamensis]